MADTSHGNKERKMKITLDELCRKIEQAEPHAHCYPLPGGDQAVVTFDNRPDTEISLLMPMAQRQIREGYLNFDLYTELLFTIRSIASR